MGKFNEILEAIWRKFAKANSDLPDSRLLLAHERSESEYDEEENEKNRRHLEESERTMATKRKPSQWLS